MAAARARSRRVLLGCFGVLGLVALVALGIELAVDGPRGLLIFLRGGPKPVAAPTPTAEELAEEARDRSIRLWRDNQKRDDRARERGIMEALAKAGQRCDAVQSALMQERGVWLVSCAPGYRYRFSFDSFGQLTTAARLP